MPACRAVGKPLLLVAGAAAGAFGSPGFTILRITFFGSAGVPLGFTAGGASTRVPSGFLIILLTTFFGPGTALPAAAPGGAVGAGLLAGGAALIFVGIEVLLLY